MLVAVAAVRSLTNFYETAVRLANCAQSSSAALEEELLQIEMRKREVEAQLHLAWRISALQILSRYAGPTFNPRCWIDHGTASNLQRTSKRTSSTEIIAGLFNGKAMLGCRENEGPTQIADLKVDNAGHC